MATRRPSHEAIAIVRRRLSAPDIDLSAIARECGVSRWTVWRIQRRLRSDGTRYSRCPTCGAKVKKPCLACTLEAAI